jgi:hypothetical protein
MNGLISKNDGVFCMLNCFDNYSIVAAQVIEFYIQNAAKASLGEIRTMSYFRDTPYMFYATWLLAQQNPDYKFNRSKQYTDYITILSLTAVTLARIFDSRAVVYPHQGVTPQAGFSTMYAYANMMNKLTVYWTDDLRNLWGTSEDPLMIGMAPLPYRYLWNAATNPAQKVKQDLNIPTTQEQQKNQDLNPQYKGLNGFIRPNIGSDTNLCPSANTQEFIDKWNTFFDAFRIGKNTSDQNTGGMSNRMMNLITIGRNIIKYVEVDKQVKFNNEYGPGGWTSLNLTLFYDMEYIIMNSKNLLYDEEQKFIDANPSNPSISSTIPLMTKMTMGEPKPHLQFVNKKQLLADSMMKGFQMMNQTEEHYEYFDY